MQEIQYSNHGFDQIPSALYEWGDFFSAMRYELECLINSEHVGTVKVILPQQECSECSERFDDRYNFQLTFYLFEDETKVAWAGETLGADSFLVDLDLTWSYEEDDMGKIHALTQEFNSWLNNEKSRAGKIAVCAVAIAKEWLENPPGMSTGLALQVRGKWAH